MTTAAKQEIPEEYKRVLKLLPVGAAKPIPAAEVEKLTGVSRRRIRSIVHDSIVSYGVLVGSSNRPERHGYFLAETEEERAEVEKGLNSVLMNTAKRLKAFKTAPPVDQTTFDFLD